SIPDPQAEETFTQARLSWSWPEGSVHAGLRQLYRDLLHARRDWPALNDREHTKAALHSTPNSQSTASLLVIQRGELSTATAIANLTPVRHSLTPLIEQMPARPQLSTEAARYHGE